MSNDRKNHGVSRREFLPAAGSGLAFTIVPRHVLGGTGTPVPSDKLNIAGVGIGGMGANYVKGCESENIVALCDVDDVLGGKTFAKYPKAKTYRDYRVMLEKEKGIDAVIVGTADHTHAIISMAAIKLGKHVYCAKPMTRTIHEARAVANAARETKVATQMSVQSCASEGACATAEWVQSGVIGQVREVHAWSDRPIWPQSIGRPAETVATPATFDWDLWLGPAQSRPYNPIYHPFNFRGWYDFGTGALGDMGCHTLHVIFRALGLAHPTSVQASTTVVQESSQTPDRPHRRTRKGQYPETFPHSSIVTWDFPSGVRVHWYDGGLRPARPLGMDPGKTLGADGILFVGSKGVIRSGFSGGPSLVSEALRKSFTPPPKTLERSTGHYMEWVAAAKGGKPAKCEFGFGSLLTETAILGSIAQRTGAYLEWDAAAGRFTNNEQANLLVNPPYRTGWSL